MLHHHGCPLVIRPEPAEIQSSRHLLRNLQFYQAGMGVRLTALKREGVFGSVNRCTGPVWVGWTGHPLVHRGSDGNDYGNGPEKKVLHDDRRYVVITELITVPCSRS